MALSVIIAAYNEEKRIGNTLVRIAGYLAARGMEHEIIVVDDGSRDATKETVTSLQSAIPNLSVIRYEVNRGKGYALRTGVLASRGKMVLVSDADLSTPIEELEKLAPPILAGECKVTIGSRALALSELVRKQPWWRRGMGRIFNRIVRLLVLDGISDTQCGFKAFAGDVARELFGRARVDRFAYDVEILALARQKGYGVREIPITWKNSPDSRVHPVVDSLQMLCDLCRIRLALGRCSQSAETTAVTYANPCSARMRKTPPLAAFNPYRPPLGARAVAVGRNTDSTR